MSTEAVNLGQNAGDGSQAPEGHDAAMVAKAEAVEKSLGDVGKDEPKAPSGEKLLGKFESQEDLVKAYQELEKRLGQKGSEQGKEDAANLTDDAVVDLVEKAGIDVNSLAAHYEANGSLSEEHYASLEKAGIPRSYVDQYISGAEAEAQQLQQSLLGEVGGKEAFGAISQWAAANLSAQELEQYNAAVDSADLATVRSAVMGLAYRYQRDNGKEPSLVGGAQGGSGSAYQSLAQLTADMADPRYDKDPAFRKTVEQKLARSNI